MPAAVDKVELPSTRTAFDERGAAYTLYQLQLGAGGTTWTVEKRFR